MQKKAEQAVILAAGMGSRLQSLGHGAPISKPLVKLAGEEMIMRTMRTLNSAGIKHFVVVLGYMADELRSFIEKAVKTQPFSVDFVYNPKWNGFANGLSLLVAEKKIDGPFLLSMCDHAFDREIPSHLIEEDDARFEVRLCIDRKIKSVYDLDDATKVVTENDRIVAIGKDLAEYDAVDCGVFLCRAGIFAELHAVEAEKGDASLSDGMRHLGAKNKFGYMDIGQAMWQDADTPETLEHAEKLMADGIIRFP